jgi:hypothetical protein
MNSLLTRTFRKLDVLSEKEQEIIVERILFELKYLQIVKAKSNSKTDNKKKQKADLKIINRKAAQLNKEAMDVLSYQVQL